jgi:hypothetical protein
MKTIFKLLLLTFTAISFLFLTSSPGLMAQAPSQDDPNDGPLAQPLTQELQAARKPVIVLPEVEYWAGDVDPSSNVAHSFVVRNGGDGDLLISKVVPGCGCSVASFPAFIPAGGEGVINLSVDIYAEWAGHNINKSAVVMSNDPVNPDIRITIRARVREAKAS